MTQWKRTFFLGFPTPKRREPKTRLLGQLGDISPKCFKSSVTISEEAPGSGSLQRFTISRDGGQGQNPLPLRSAHVIIIVLEIHYSPDDGAQEFVLERS